MTHDGTGSADRMGLRSPRRGAYIVFGLFTGVAGMVGLCTPDLFSDFPPQAVEMAGVLAVALGFVVLLYRSGAIIDRDAQMVTLWWGLPAPLHRKVQEIVPMACRLTRTFNYDEHYIDIYHTVALVSAGRDIPLVRHRDSVRAWRVAQDVAAFLGVELIDESERLQREFWWVRAWEKLADRF